MTTPYTLRGQYLHDPQTNRMMYLVSDDEPIPHMRGAVMLPMVEGHLAFWRRATDAERANQTLEIPPTETPRWAYGLRFPDGAY